MTGTGSSSASKTRSRQLTDSRLFGHRPRSPKSAFRMLACRFSGSLRRRQPDTQWFRLYSLDEELDQVPKFSHGNGTHCIELFGHEAPRRCIVIYPHADLAFRADDAREIVG